MDYFITGGIILFGLIVTFFLWRTTQDVVSNDIKTSPTIDYLEDEFEVSYVFLPTDSADEYGRLKGFSYKRGLTITTLPHYKGTNLKFGDKVKYRYLGNQIDNVELV